jgi:hypothetical protein
MLVHLRAVAAAMGRRLANMARVFAAPPPASTAQPKTVR